jgi:hypothetical protein
MWETGRVEGSPEPASRTAAETGRVRVLYVMGAGRSGSTILGVALGNCEDVFFAGELDRWFARGGVPRDGMARKRFWSSVGDEMGETADVFAADTTVLERSSALLDIRGWRARRLLRRRYRQVSQELYLAIARASGATHIVDSSHYPLRARELRGCSGVEVYVLFLVRDPQSVVASLGRRDVPERRFGVIAANAYLWLTHAVSLFVYLCQPRERRMFIRHEDFLADPQGILGAIMARCGSTVSTLELEHLQTGVPFHGNRLIREREIALEAHDARPTRRSLLTTALQLPWVAIFARLRSVSEPAGALEPTTGRR